MDIPQTSELSPLEIEPDERERITALTRSLPRHSLVKAAILRYFDGEAVPSASILIEGLLEGRTSAERAVSAWALGVIPASGNQVGAIVEALARSMMPVELRLADDDRRKRLLYSGGACIGALVFLDVVSHAVMGPGGIPVLDALAGAACFAGVPFWLVASTLWSDPHNVTSTESLEAAKALGARPEAEGIEALSAAIGAADDQLRGTAILAFLRKAAAIAELPYGSAGPQSIRGLGRALAHEDLRVVDAALDSLNAVGNSAAIDSVQWLLASNAPETIKTKARAILLILEERKINEDHAAVLLRPTCNPHGPSDRLLHIPTHAVHAQDILLRPTNADSSDAESDS